MEFDRITQEKMYSTIVQRLLSAKADGNRESAVEALHFLAGTMGECTRSAQDNPMVFKDFVYDPDFLFDTSKEVLSSMEADKNITSKGLLFEILELANTDTLMARELKTGVFTLHASLSSKSGKSKEDLANLQRVILRLEALLK